MRPTFAQAQAASVLVSCCKRTDKRSGSYQAFFLLSSSCRADAMFDKVPLVASCGLGPTFLALPTLTHFIIFPAPLFCIAILAAVMKYCQGIDPAANAKHTPI